MCEVPYGNSLATPLEVPLHLVVGGNRLKDRRDVTREPIHPTTQKN